MLKPSSSKNDYIVRELKPSEHDPTEASITINCESSSAIAMHLKAGVSGKEARDIADTQAKAKGLCYLVASRTQQT